MENFDEMIEQCTVSFASFGVVEMQDIPNIDLYMDQVTTFMDRALTSYKRKPDDKILTKTMINNYTKAKIFPAPNKKKYNRSHLMLLIIIYHLKSILCIHDIGVLIRPLIESLDEKQDDTLLQEVYCSFVKVQKDVIAFYSSRTFPSHDMMLKEVILSHEKETIKKILLVLMVSLQANKEKHIAEYALDHYFEG